MTSEPRPDDRRYVVASVTLLVSFLLAAVALGVLLATQ